ncbi:MAG: nucleotide exchange factor GrpE [bacterium]|nr:nucleotide exchange factor GrpE [bacterium]
MKDKKAKEKDEQLEQKIETENEVDCQKCEEYLEGWKRAKADYSNLQKTVEHERGELRKYATEDLLQAILPAIDQYDVALQFTPDIQNLPEDQKSVFKNWLIGIHAVRDIWERTFESIGLTTVREEGAFDPEMHEAVKEEDSDLKPGTILSVQQKGWKLKDKLLRPAKVTISK